MPIFDYLCKDCGLKTTVIRNIHETDILPGDGEGETVLKGTACTYGGKPHLWEKQLGGFTVTRGKNWGRGSKGNW